MFQNVTKILSMGVALVTKCIVKKTNLIRKTMVMLHKPLVSLKKWFYTSNKTECFNYEDGICISRHLKEVLVWAIVKYFWFSNNVILLKQLYY